MMGIDWIGFVVASIAVVLAPGPGSLFVAKSAASSGSRAGLGAMAGLMAGDACLIMFSFIGVYGVFQAFPALFHFVRLVGAGYLIFTGIQSMFRSTGSVSEPKGRTGFSFRRSLVITLLNPKAVFFFMAFFPLFIKEPEGGLYLQYTCLTLVFMIVSATYLGALTHLAARGGSHFRQSKVVQTLAKKVGGGIFVLFGIKVAMSSEF